MVQNNILSELFASVKSTFVDKILGYLVYFKGHNCTCTSLTLPLHLRCVHVHVCICTNDTQNIPMNSDWTECWNLFTYFAHKLKSKCSHIYIYITVWGVCTINSMTLPHPLRSKPRSFSLRLVLNVLYFQMQRVNGHHRTFETSFKKMFQKSITLIKSVLL